MAVWIVQVVDGGVEPTLGTVRRFSDVGNDHPYVAYIERVAELGVTLGCGDGTRFCPNDTVTRGQVAAFLVRAFDLPVPESSAIFDDIDTGHRFATEIAAIAAAGITIGCGDGSNYCDRATITQHQLSTMLDRSQSSKGQTVKRLIPTQTSQVTTAVAAADPVPQENPAPQQVPVVQETGDMLLHDFYYVDRVGLEALEVSMNVLLNDECVTGCNNLSIKYAPKVGVTRWDNERLMYSVPLGTALPDWAVSFGYETDTSPWNAIATIVINEISASSDDDPPPVDPSQPADNSFQQIATGNNFWCGIKATGAIECQGNNADGQLSNIPAGTDFNEITAGQDHVCARRTDNTVECWGDNDDGESADQGSATYEMIAAGYNLTCGIKTMSKEIECWGSNTDNARDNHPTAENHKYISVGEKAVCAIDNDDKLICWGNNTNNLQTEPGDDFTSVAVGSGHACAIKTNNTVECWGDDNGGATTPNDQFQSLTAGADHTCGRKADNTVVCWGQDTDENLSVPQGTTKAIASHGTATCALSTTGLRRCWGHPYTGQTQVPDESFKYVDVGTHNSCGIVKSNSSLKCWGSNSDGQSNAPQSGTYSQLAVGDIHACAVKTDNTASCWGSTANNRTISSSVQSHYVSAGLDFSCALNETSAINCWSDPGVPQRSTPWGLFTHIASARAAQYSCGIRTNEDMACWGADPDSYGLLTARSGDYRTVDVGNQHACAIKKDRSLDCWGRNTEGQITQQSGTDFLAVAAGHTHSCAIKANGNNDYGSIICWGDNAYGKASPPSGSTFTAVAAGRFHTCALNTDDDVICWGVTDRD